ncbi:hypothetical protein LF1_14750 [Rubripirellula obstinata]|uniref:Uncharacterized protein n=1 Tax=Rubripirellula obstinata TaxID=406547 RepID=A0A5B1CFG7_9BACT|nr:hypothetical protein [Rubripirellula obstinata]KAA1258951.1 hypothetical protein LF1_14750 [Rubripirellula obstinata]
MKGQTGHDHMLTPDGASAPIISLGCEVMGIFHLAAMSSQYD